MWPFSQLHCVEHASCFRAGSKEETREAVQEAQVAIHELAEFADKGAFLGIGRTESLCLKCGNHFVENALRKAFIKRSVTLQPSEEQGTSKHIDQQFWIGRRLQFS